ncbi:MAG: hypothetical protein CK548_02555 [Opitutia bacterium]|nr:hypothetical protein [Opitutaceae bacterium]PHX72962.1 MAG: hypothetical protein CK548_02555 [Opitutae bacterium]
MLAVFLRLQSAREQIALPYSSLIKLELKNDATAVELSCVTHRVMITGRNIDAIYQAVAEAQARLVMVATTDFTGEFLMPAHRALVREIRTNPLDTAERRKR